MDMSAYANFVFPIIICLSGYILFLFCASLYCKANPAVIFGKRNIDKRFFSLYLTWLALFLLVPSNFWLKIWYTMIGQGSAEIDVSEIFSGSFNVVPRFFRYLRGEATYGGWTYRMLLSNIILFIPFGMLVPSILKKKSFKNVIFTSVIFASGIELIQPVVGRSFDIDDIMMRTIGGMIGFFVYLRVKNRRKRTI